MTVRSNKVQRTRFFVPKTETPILKILTESLRQPETRSHELIGLGAVWINDQRLLDPTQLVAAKQTVRVCLLPSRYPVQNVQWEKIILSDREDFLVLDKPAGIPVHATNDNLIENVLEVARKRWGNELLILNRLDTPVGGVLALAKSSRIQSEWNRSLAEGEIRKRYLALTDRPTKTGKYEIWISDDSGKKRETSATERAGFKRASLEIESTRECSVEGEQIWTSQVRLLTGRTHQIRAQFEALGHPLLGDRKYGSNRRFRLGVAGFHSIGLHCTEMAWNFRGVEARHMSQPRWPGVITKKGA